MTVIAAPSQDLGGIVRENFPFGANDRFKESIHRSSLTGIGRQEPDARPGTGHLTRRINS
jgi:hypothetical protein